MSDIQPGDLVVVVESRFCTYGEHEEDMPLVGKVGRVTEIETDEEGDWAFLDIFNGQDVCLGCCRKLNDGQDDAALIARIKSCQPIRAKEPTS